MLPIGFAEKMERLLGAEFEAFLASYDRPLAPGLRENPRKRAPAAMLADFHLTDVPWARDGHYYDLLTRPGLSPLHDAGASSFLYPFLAEREDDPRYARQNSVWRSAVCRVLAAARGTRSPRPERRAANES